LEKRNKSGYTVMVYSDTPNAPVLGGKKKHKFGHQGKEGGTKLTETETNQEPFHKNKGEGKKVDRSKKKMKIKKKVAEEAGEKEKELLDSAKQSQGNPRAL